MKVFVVFLLMVIIHPIQSQHLIGLPKEGVDKELQTNYKNFVIDNSSVNNTYKYLKYIDKFHDQTLLVFLSEKNVCTSTKLMSDYSNLITAKNNLNKKYKKAGKDKWIYSVQGTVYLVSLKQEEWFFTIYTRKKE